MNAPRKPYASRAEGDRKPYAPRGDAERKPYAPRAKATASPMRRVVMRNASPMHPVPKVTASPMPRAKHAARMTANPAGRPKARRNRLASNPMAAARIARPRRRATNPTPPPLRVTNPKVTGHPASRAPKVMPPPAHRAPLVQSQNGNPRVKVNLPTNRAVPKGPDQRPFRGKPAGGKPRPARQTRRAKNGCQGHVKALCSAKEEVILQR